MCEPSPRNATAVPTCEAYRSNQARLPPTNVAKSSVARTATAFVVVESRVNPVPTVPTRRVSQTGASSSRINRPNPVSQSLDRHSLHSWSPVPPKPRSKAPSPAASESRKRIPSRARSFSSGGQNQQRHQSSQETSQNLSPRRWSMSESRPPPQQASLSTYLSITKLEHQPLDTDCTSELSVCGVVAQLGRSGYESQQKRRFSFSEYSASQEAGTHPPKPRPTDDYLRNYSSNSSSSNTSNYHTVVAAPVLRRKNSGHLRPWPTNPQRQVKTSTTNQILSLDLPEEMVGDVPIVDREVTTLVSTSSSSSSSTISSQAETVKVRPSIIQFGGPQPRNRPVEKSLVPQRVVPDQKNTTIPLKGDESLQESFPPIEWPSFYGEDYSEECRAKSTKVEQEQLPQQGKEQKQRKADKQQQQMMVMMMQCHACGLPTPKPSRSASHAA